MKKNVEVDAEYVQPGYTYVLNTNRAGWQQKLVRII